MTYTKNEQTFVLSAESGTEGVEKIKQFLSTSFGWVIDGDYVYLNNSKLLGFKIVANSNSAQITPCNYLTLGKTVTTTATSSTIYYHVAEDGKTIYISFGATGGVVVAEDVDGNLYIFAAAGTNSVSVLTYSLDAAIAYQFMGAVNDNYSYAIQKMPSYLFNSVFSSLFSVFSVSSTQLRNQLVSFKGKIYRIIYMSGNKSYPTFAFPVGNQEE